MPRASLLRTVGVLALAAGLGLSSQGCTRSSNGTPSPATATATSTTVASAPPTSTTTTNAGPSLAGVDPCALLTAADLTQLGLAGVQADRATVAGRLACNWSKPGAGLGVYVDQNRGLADLNTNRATRVEDRTVGSHQGRLVEKPGGYCDIDIAVTEKSSVTVSMTTLDNPPAACPAAESAAALVEPRLPRG